MTDMITYLPRTPGPGETIAGEQFELGCGGKGANQAVMASRLGAGVVMVNSVGDDVFGEMALANFRRAGIDTTHVSRAPGCSTGAAPIWVEPDGTNRIVVVPGANECMEPAQAVNALTTLDRVDLALGQLEIPQRVTAAGLRAARERGALTVLNPAPAANLDPALLNVVDWLVPNETEFAVLAHAAGIPAHGLIEDGAIVRLGQALGTRLAVTLGARGVAILRTDGHVTRMTPPEVSARDSTGAGDAFVGALCYGLAAGTDEAEAAWLGCRCAAISVTRHGTQKSFPTYEELTGASDTQSDGGSAGQAMRG